MATIVKVSLLHPMTLNLGNTTVSYRPGLREMPYEHAQALGVLHRIRGQVADETQTEPAEANSLFVALDTLFEERTAALLSEAGYSNLAELSKASPDQLRAIPGIGPARYEEIQAVLGRRMSVEEEGE